MKKRNRKKYAIHYKDGEEVDWVGNVIDETETHVVIHCVDAVCLLCGMWSLSDQKTQVPINECAFFTEMADAKNACDLANEYFV